MKDLDNFVDGRGGLVGAFGVDQGLRNYMLSVYSYMGLSLLVTGLVSLVSRFVAVTERAADAAVLADGSPVLFAGDLYLTPFGVSLYGGPLMFLLMFLSFGLVMAVSVFLNSMSLRAVQVCFWAYSMVFGVTLSSVLVVFTDASVVQVFFVSAAAFAGLSLYGYVTERDLSPVAAFGLMGLIGLVALGLVNLFLQSSMLHFVLSLAGVLVFSALAVYDTQRIKENYSAGDSAGVLERKAIVGALSLYLDFVNLFLSLLYLFGQRR